MKKSVFALIYLFLITSLSAFSSEAWNGTRLDGSFVCTQNSNNVQISGEWQDYANSDLNCEGNEIKIKDGADLAQIGMLVKGGNTFQGKRLVLDNDIDLGTHYWNPIGSPNSGKYFSGSFIGNGNIIRNLTIKDESNDDSNVYNALFGYVKSGTDQNQVVKFENVKIEGASIYSKNSSESNYCVYSAALIARLELKYNNETLLECHVASSVIEAYSNSSAVDGTASYASSSGLVGYFYKDGNNLNFRNCSTINTEILAKGSNQSYAAAGGIIGVLYGPDNNPHIKFDATFKTENLNIKSISINKPAYAGGIVGASALSKNSKIEFISPVVSNSIIVASGNKGYAAGLLGALETGTSVTVSDKIDLSGTVQPDKVINGNSFGGDIVGGYVSNTEMKDNDKWESEGNNDRVDIDDDANVTLIIDISKPNEELYELFEKGKGKGKGNFVSDKNLLVLNSNYSYTIIGKNQNLTLDAHTVVGRLNFPDMEVDCVKLDKIIIGSECRQEGYLAYKSEINLFDGCIISEKGIKNIDNEAVISTGVINYFREFNVWVVTGEGEGWSTISLPFNADLILVENGEEVKLKPVNNDYKDGKYWLRMLKTSSNENLDFDNTKSIRFNTPYIIALPGEAWGNFSLVNKNILFRGYGEIKEHKDTHKADSEVWGNYDLITSINSLKANDVQVKYILNADGEAKAQVANSYGNVDGSEFIEISTDIKPFRAYLEKNTISYCAAPRIRYANDITNNLLSLKDKNVNVWISDKSVFISVENDLNINIFTLDGRIVKSIFIQSGITQLSDLCKGVYIIEGRKIIL